MRENIMKQAQHMMKMVRINNKNVDQGSGDEGEEEGGNVRKQRRRVLSQSARCVFYLSWIVVFFYFFQFTPQAFYF